MSNHPQMNDFIVIPGSEKAPGRRVYVRRSAGNTLREFARSGNYHKVSLVKMLMGLTAGHDHQDNVLQLENPAKRNPRHFFIVLPGCTAEIILHPNGHYYVDNLRAKAEASGAKNSTGLYRAVKVVDRWESSSNDRLTSNESVTTIAITDSSKSSDAAAAQGAKALSGSDYVRKSTFKDFNLHHTYGTQSITGFTRRKNILKPLSNKDIMDSSRRLANVMLQARTESQRIGDPEKRKQVAWVSTRGGSAVLTQALYRLKRQGITFHGHNHHVYFHEIGSDIDQAVKLALDVGFKMPAKPFSKRLWSLNSLAVGGGYGATEHRFKAQKDYTRAMATLEHADNTITAPMAYLGAACLVTGQLWAGSAAMAAAGVARKGYAGVKLADSVAEDVAGKQYEFIKRWLGVIK